MEILWILGAIYCIYLFFWAFFIHGHLREISKDIKALTKKLGASHD